MIDSEANFEYNISKTIQFIPLNKNYFIFSTDICKPANIIDQEKEKDINKCKILQGKELGDFKVLSMPYGGVSLNNFTFTPQFINNFDKFAIHLLEGVALLNLFGIVHRDLHSGNIVIDQSFVPRIIDFNLSLNIRKKENITVDLIRHAYIINLMQEPPDGILINAIAQGHDDNILHDIIYKNSILKKVSILTGKSLDEMWKELDDFYNKSKIMKSGSDLDWLNTYWTVIDSWAWATNIMILIFKLLNNVQFERLWNNNLAHKYIPVLSKMLSASPVARIDAIQALYLLKPESNIIRHFGQLWLKKRGFPGL